MKWIIIKEKLPKETDEYLCTVEGLDKPQIKEWLEHAPDSAQHGEWAGKHNGKVLAWMKLPEIWKE